MLNYAETASSSSIVPLASLSQSQYQQDTAQYVSSVSSYAIGPISPAQLVARHGHLSAGEECRLLTPARLC
jgi:hypothetical protein